MEQQLGNLLVASIDNSKAISEVFKAVDTFDGFTDRQPVQQKWQNKQTEVLNAVYEDLLAAQETFYQGDAAGVYVNMPPVAATVVRCKALLDRINETHSHLHELAPIVVESDRGHETTELYENLRALLQETIANKYKAWSNEVGVISASKLHLPLLVLTP